MLNGCRTGGNLATVNNHLREDNLALRDENATLTRRVEELELSLKTKSAGEGELPAEIQANLPRVTAISLDPLSHLAFAEHVGMVTAFIKPTDGRGRFTQMVGKVSMQLIATPEGTSAVTLASRTFDAFEVREAYRSSFMGTHYTFEMPIEPVREKSVASLLLVVQYEDGVTGAKLMAERQMMLPSESR